MFLFWTPATNSDESGGSSEEETNENSFPLESTVGLRQGGLVEEELGEDNILQLPQDLANVSCSVDLMLYFYV